MKKPISPAAHGIMDYVLGTVQAAAPLVLGMNQTATITHQAASVAMTAVNMLTNTPVGLKPVLSMKDHQKADIGLLGGMALMTLIPAIHNDKKALGFHLGFLAMALTQFLLTDFDGQQSSARTR